MVPCKCIKLNLGGKQDMDMLDSILGEINSMEGGLNMKEPEQKIRTVYVRKAPERKKKANALF